MNYLKIYNNIIENAKIKNNDINRYYEIHHIIPKCLGGTDEQTNLIKLSLREHYICHKILCEIYPENKSLAHAYWMMTIMTIGALENFKQNNLYRKDGYEQRRIKSFLNNEIINISSREYEWCKEHWKKLAIGIKRNEEQCKRISNATKKAMKDSKKIQKCRANLGSHYYHEILTGKVHKWFPGDPELDLTKYKWGRGQISKEQKEKISRTQLLEKTICRIGKTNYRYCWYKDFIKEIPNIFLDLKQKQSNKLKNISKCIFKSLSLLKDQNIFIDEYIFIRPINSKGGLTIISPAVYEICINVLETEDPQIIGQMIINNLDIIKELNKKYFNEKYYNIE